MGRKKNNGANKRSGGRYIPLETRILKHEAFIKLSPYATKLLFDLMSQFNGYNNGDLCCTWSIMKDRNWKSQSTLNEARIDLINAGFIYKTRQGGKNHCSLYALSFFGVTDRKGRFDFPVSEHPRNLFMVVNQDEIIREEKPKRKKERSRSKKFANTAAVHLYIYHW